MPEQPDASTDAGQLKQPDPDAPVAAAAREQAKKDAQEGGSSDKAPDAEE